MNKFYLTGTVIQKHTSADGKIIDLTVVPLNEKSEKTKFIKVRSFENTSKVIEKYFDKGARIGIEGHLSNYVSEKDGKKTYHQEAIVDQIEFLEKKSKDTEEPIDDVDQEE